MTARQAPAAGAPAAAAGTADAGRRPDGSMSLLVDLMTNTLDLGYAERAAARNDPPPTASGSGARHVGRLVGVVALVVLGLLTGTAVATVRERAVASTGVRTRLVDEVHRRSAESAQLQQRAAALRSDVAAQRDRALAADDQGRQLGDRVRALELAAAVTAVTGPGVVLTVDDAPAPKDSTATDVQRGGTSAAGRVLDRDLQGVVNGLWAAGAEAVAINGLRLSSRTAIRSAGEAVLVDFRPISPPYKIEAVGRTNALETGFVDGPSGRRLQTLSSFSGITYHVGRADHLRLPAATEPQLRAARPAPEPS